MRLKLRQLRAIIAEALDFNSDINRLVMLHKDRLPGRLGHKLGEGGDGNVYAFGVGGSIKVGRLSKMQYASLERVLNELERLMPEGVAEIYEHDVLTEEDGDVIYYYVMEKLAKLTHDEGVAVGRMTFGIDGNDKLPADLQDRVAQFAQAIEKLPFEHLDPSPNNVMKSRRSVFKFVDIESFVPGID